MSKLILPLILFSLLSTVLCSISFQSSAHGYVITPPSRSYMCFVRDYSGNQKTPDNLNCGDGPTYYPQSLEALKNFPASGPVDGNIASVGDITFAPLDEQTPDRWKKTELKTGSNKFTWFLTAAHKTTNWRYFITKTGWDQSSPLTRASFDLTPFCQRDDNGAAPPLATPIDFQCTIPADRTGYHVILAVWDVYDTTNAFYQVIDVNLTK